MKVIVGVGLSALLTAGLFWIVQWSPLAKECFAKGGTAIDPLTFQCSKRVPL